MLKISLKASRLDNIVSLVRVFLFSCALVVRPLMRIKITVRQRKEHSHEGVCGACEKKKAILRRGSWGS
jgi:hypothetical protein